MATESYLTGRRVEYDAKNQKFKISLNYSYFMNNKVRFSNFDVFEYAIWGREMR
ncbi:MAG: hypothetical protein CM15mP127_12720 [Gammaproteobacteria bacterium]|nr:MAG: hypothetical protein CM15mP127_12720 [Gammaproteobacteria bacterium]